MKMFLLAGLLIATVACNKTESSRSESSNNNGQGGTDTTPYAQCDGGLASTPMGKWMQSFQDGKLTAKLVLYISSNQVTVSNTCKLDGRTLQANASAAARVTNDQISILGSDSDEKRINEQDFNMNCNANLVPETMSYSFKGRCLVLTGADGKSLTMVPTY